MQIIEGGKLVNWKECLNVVKLRGQEHDHDCNWSSHSGNTDINKEQACGENLHCHISQMNWEDNFDIINDLYLVDILNDLVSYDQSDWPDFLDSGFTASDKLHTFKTIHLTLFMYVY